MDFQSYGIDERLSRAIEGMSVASNFFEKMLERAVQKNENVCAKISLSNGVEEVCLLPALQWLASAPEGELRRVLVAAPDAGVARAAATAAASLGAGIGASSCLVLEVEGASPEDPPAFEGDPASSLLVGTPAALFAASSAG